MSKKATTKKATAKKVVVPKETRPKAKKAPAKKALTKNEFRDSVATSFADPADVRRFRVCKQKGHSDTYCFNYGDNGIGAWGDNTAQEKTPMVALPPEHMIEKFGRWQKAHKAKVLVEVNGRTTEAIVADRMPFRKYRRYENMIDLNPAALKKLSLKAPLKIDAKWKWV